MINPVSVGKNIKLNREKLNITQQELAEKLFVSYQAVSAWERGIALPDLENTVKLADIFNVKIDKLLNEKQVNNLYIAIDGGGTKTEFILFDKEGFVKKKLILSGSNPNDIGIEKSIEILSKGIDELSKGASLQGIFAGIAGITTGSHKTDIQKRLYDKYGIPVFTDTDAVNVLAMGEDLENTASVICGTGSCVFVRKNFNLTRIGGWGYLFDRAGSAYDIGNDAIRHTLAVYDKLEKPTLLSSLIEEKAEGDIWKNLSNIYTKGRSFIASFAPLVTEAAEKGDETSKTILEANTDRLAKLIKHAKKEYGAPDTFVCAGGFFKNTLFKNMLEQKAGVKLFVPKAPPAYGACVECMRLCKIDCDESFQKNFIESYR